jgi:dipeptidyl aminopeptidase/acylaminoacyl peptidase
MKMVLATVGLSAWLTVGGQTAVSPPLLTYRVDVPLSTDPSYPAGLCVAMSDGSRRLRLTELEFISDPDWSPDGRQIAYSRGNDIFVANARGGGERNLTRAYANLSSQPAWSPDGRRIAFTAHSPQGSSRIGMIDRNGSNLRLLNLSVPGNQSGPTWSPNGRELALVSQTLLPPVSALYVAEISGARSRLLASNAGDASWSPDGSRLVYGAAGGVMAVNSDGTGGRTLAPGATSPDWSPDGRLIAYTRNEMLLVARPDGSGERVVIAGPFPVHGPAWRPASSERTGTPRPCIQTGTSRADAIRGTSSDEIILAGRGADTVFAGGGNDIVVGGAGHDFLNGEAGNDHVVGSAGRDRMYGARGDDSLHALDSESDIVDGGPGSDRASRDEGLFGNARDRLRSIER